MSGVTQATFMNQRSFVEPPPTVIGQAFGGGFYAGDISVAGNGVASHYLVVASKSGGESTTLRWSVPQVTTGITSVIAGPTNSASLAALGYPMASFCENLNMGGYTDWYMPAKNELEVCYYNLKPTTTSNWTASGTNTNAVPSRGSNYTAGTPARTAATVFQTGNAQAFNSTFYFASTEFNANDAWAQTFNDGTQSNANKTYNFLGWGVRAVRRVPI